MSASGAVVLSVDVKQFTQAVTQYVRETGRDSASVLNRKAASMFFQAAKVAPRAAAAALRRKARSPRYVAALLSKGGHYTREEARAYSAALAKRYSRAAGFVRAYLRSAGNAIAGRAATAKAKGIQTDVHRATAEKLQVYSGNAYQYRRRKGPATAAETILETSLKNGIAAETADTLQHLSRRMAARAKEHSAK